MKIRFLLATTAILLCAVFFAKNSRVESSSTSRIEALTTPGASPSQTGQAAFSGVRSDSLTANPAATSETSIQPKPSRDLQPPLREIMPSKEQLRREVEADPHETPRALLDFSVSLFDREVLGLQSEDKARALLSELETCTLGPEQKGMHSLQAICLMTARRLKNTYPGLASHYDQLEHQADPQAVRLMSDVGQ
jgi:hypothetical protein